MNIFYKHCFLKKVSLKKRRKKSSKKLFFVSFLGHLWCQKEQNFILHHKRYFFRLRKRVKSAQEMRDLDREMRDLDRERSVGVSRSAFTRRLGISLHAKLWKTMQNDVKKNFSSCLSSGTSMKTPFKALVF
jgi:hypothetical protein